MSLSRPERSREKKSLNTMPIHGLVLKESADLMKILELTIKSGHEL